MKAIHISTSLVISIMVFLSSTCDGLKFGGKSKTRLYKLGQHMAAFCKGNGIKKH